jgi:uncharacterized protein (DUF305 family)
MNRAARWLNRYQGYAGSGDPDIDHGSPSGRLLSSGSGRAARPAASPRATSSEASAPDNANDAAFLRLEVAHHDQAIEMADLALRKTHNARLRSLAGQIKTVQSSEFTAMHGRLRTWPAETETTGTRTCDPAI